MNFIITLLRVSFLPAVHSHYVGYILDVFQWRYLCNKLTIFLHG